MVRQIQLQLRQLRQERTLSQDELARQLGISRQSVISLERGEYLPSLPLLIEMIRFFDCSIDNLIKDLSLTKRESRVNQLEKGGEQEVMQLMPWNPFQAIDRLQDEMSDLVERTLGRADWTRTLGSSVGAMNIHEDDKEYRLELQVPGFQDDEINIEIGEDTVTVSGAKKVEKKEEKKTLVRREWEQTEFSRTIRFAQPIKDESAEAKLENGTLIITVPKITPTKPKTKKLAVKRA